ncbi:Ca2+-binding RTX toxin-like protein [Sinorhizobium kostiense]|uniref:Ca2+-binding RTX toxin-like protein n=1 Tax=Sinorhizobium kostiense TaxID=76747 RepID=A0ABS4QX75_9HYPH|nr:calcium-binding protein [Sinorhizobium kostiense]MBP2235251.1 Ca2+-binding RTX toxin-like protein [Sinorhizobium kostiense]
MASINGTNADDVLSGVDNEYNFIRGFDGNDSLYGGSLADTIFGDDGNDFLSGDDGLDNLSGGSGDDTLWGGEGGDVLSSGSGFDWLYGDGGDDTFYLSSISSNEIKRAFGGTGDDLFFASFASDILDGGRGQDLVDYNNSFAGVTVNLMTGIGSGGAAEGDTYRSIEDVQGSAYNDNLTGNGNFNELFGDAGDDVVAGGEGGDYLDGGMGADTLSYRASDAGVQINLTTGFAWGGDAQGDQFILFERVWGSDFSDTLTGDGSANFLQGFLGNDRLYGQTGNDRLYSHGGSDTLDGGAGDDILKGGTENDVLIGGVGADDLYGEAGADRFDFNLTAESTPASTGRDSIFGFSHAEGDRIDLSTIDANTKLTGNQAFAYKGTAGFSGVSGELRYTSTATDTYVYADVNGDKIADLSIHLSGAFKLVSSDFVL